MKTLLRALCPALLLAAPVLAGPPLTTIEDVIYKADGTRFNGLLTIAWASFEAPDQSDIATQMIRVKVSNGRLYVRLVPTTTTSPEIFYTVTYNSDGYVQFTETWSVPPSSVPLRIQDVRIPIPTGNGNGDDTNAQGPIPESDVTGLIADLSARPIKGPNFAPGAVALVNAQGSLDSVAGSPSNCVMVNGSSSPCGGPQPGFMDGDLPQGVINGSNATFTLSAVPAPAVSLALYRNGILQDQGVDYTLSSNVVQFAVGNIPQPGDTLLASYRLPASGGTAQLYPSPQILCNGTGAVVTGSTMSSLGACVIPPGVLAAGDHVEVKFDLAHQGTAGGFTFQVQWGATTLLQRTAAAGDAQVSGHGDAGLDVAGAQVSSESWGTLLPLAATVGSATDTYANGLTITFQASMNGPGDTLGLRNYAVVLLP
ncbi:MAG TPA: hypothetical protein VH640_16170 [Bryobacteraceae bacterium]